jgi:hypothetical protein
MRFFNRFEKEILHAMLGKAKLKIVSQNSVLYLEPYECGILVNGEIYMF